MSINYGAIMAALQAKQQQKAEADRAKSRQLGNQVGIVTGIAGGVAGAFIGGPLGAMAGFTAGQQIGSATTNAINGSYEAQDTSALISGLASAGSLYGQYQNNEIAQTKLGYEADALNMQQERNDIMLGNALRDQQQLALSEARTIGGFVNDGWSWSPDGVPIKGAVQQIPVGEKGVLSIDQAGLDAMAKSASEKTAMTIGFVGPNDEKINQSFTYSQLHDPEFMRANVGTDRAKLAGIGLARTKDEFREMLEDPNLTTIYAPGDNTPIRGNAYGSLLAGGLGGGRDMSRLEDAWQRFQLQPGATWR